MHPRRMFVCAKCLNAYSFALTFKFVSDEHDKQNCEFCRKKINGAWYEVSDGNSGRNNQENRH